MKVKVIFPLKPAGSKVFAETPLPDQLPMMPLWVVGNAIGEASSQSDAGTPEIAGVMGVATETIAVAGKAH